MQKINIGRAHSAPQEYKYVLKCYINTSEFYHLITNYYGQIFLGNINSVNGNVLFNNGEHTFLDKKIFVVNQEKQGYIYFWFICREDAHAITKHLKDLDDENNKKEKKYYYKYDRNNYWIKNGLFETKTLNYLVGYDKEFKTVVSDIENAKLYLDKFKSIGEELSSFNYLLYGPPGTGKSTFIKVLATYLDVPLYIVNHVISDQKVDLDILMRVRDGGILVFEDFDRFLESKEINMSEILNSIDGVTNNDVTIRIFTANNINIIENNPALNNRLHAKFEFVFPKREEYLSKFSLLTSILDRLVDKKKCDKFIDEVVKMESITLRPFTNYVKRYLFMKDFEEQLLNNLDYLRMMKCK